MGANSKDGFVSLFEKLRIENKELKIYAVKSGPGCGKNTCIRKLSEVFAGETGICEYIYCSSDPASLDGVVIHDKNLAVLDGTSPHVYDPKFPGAEGGYIALPGFLRPETLAEKYPRLLSLDRRSASHYSQAYKLINASHQIDTTIKDELSRAVPAQRLLKRALGIATREIPKKGGSGRKLMRFLDGITPIGEVCLHETVSALAEKIYIFYDSYGFSAPMLELISDYALQHGHTVYKCMSPVDTETVRHLIIPELSLAFVSAYGKCPLSDIAHRSVRIDAAIDKEFFMGCKGRIKLLSKISQSLLDDAVSEIAAAHSLHDEMEALYKEHVNIKALDKHFSETVESIKKLL